MKNGYSLRLLHVFATAFAVLATCAAARDKGGNDPVRMLSKAGVRIEKRSVLSLVATNENPQLRQAGVKVLASRGWGNDAFLYTVATNDPSVLVRIEAAHLVSNKSNESVKRVLRKELDQTKLVLLRMKIAGYLAERGDDGGYVTFKDGLKDEWALHRSVALRMSSKFAVLKPDEVPLLLYDVLSSAVQTSKTGEEKARKKAVAEIRRVCVVLPTMRSKSIVDKVEALAASSNGEAARVMTEAVAAIRVSDEK